MKVPIKWLSEYVDTKGLSPKQLSDGLRLSGTENVLEEAQSFENIIVGEIKSVKKHPNADKLSVAVVSDGKKDLQIVCGAPNIKKGQKVPLALVGAKFGDFEIKKAKIRDVESNGMMCAEDELGLGDDHAGIMILDEKAKVGMKFADYIGGTDTIIDAELTPNRGDCLSIIGMAREVAATFDKKMKKVSFDKAPVKSKKKIDVEVKDKELCPRYIAKVVEGIKIGPSPKWMQERLLSAGVRPISNVVDVTNYVMLEWGQPLHAFDGSKLSGKIIVRRAKDGEKMKTLDGVERKFTKSDLLICDSKKPVAVAGVMGGENSEVSEKTSIVVLEAAVFESNSIRRTAQRLANRTEASNRFEKGIPLTLPEVAIERAAQLLVEAASGRAGEVTDVLNGGKKMYPRFVGLRKSRIKEVLGIDVDAKSIVNILKSLGLEENKIDFKKEARKHVGKPYVFGAKLSTHGDMAFDCSYLTSYIFYKYGKLIGSNALAQVCEGRNVKESELQPGDLLFIGGYYDKKVPNSYIRTNPDLTEEEVTTNEYPKGVRHVGVYIGDGRVVHARETIYDSKKKDFVAAPKNQRKVVEENVEEFTKLPGYIGARRFVEDLDDYVAFQVPWWRLDIVFEEDLIEEVARVYGYEKLNSTLPSGQLPKQEKNESLEKKEKIRGIMVAAGFWEVYTYSFVSEKMMKFMGGTKNSLKISNPLSAEQEYMRKGLVPSLVQVLSKNQDNYEAMRVFELASIYFPKGKMSEEVPVLAAAVKSESGNEDAFFELKGALENSLSGYGPLTFKKEEINFCKKGQSAKIVIDGKGVGTIGMINNEYKDTFGLKYDACVASINLEGLGVEKKLVYGGIPKYPTSKRDINLVVPESVLVEKVLSIIDGQNIKILLSFSVVDIYVGKGVPEGKKSVTIRLVYGAGDRTLTEEEVTNAQNKVLKSFKKIGGELRS